jgi:hypothetical protein
MVDRSGVVMRDDAVAWLAGVRVREAAWHAIELRQHATLLADDVQLEHAGRVGLAASDAASARLLRLAVVACRSPLSLRQFAALVLRSCRVVVRADRSPAHVSSTARLSLFHHSTLRAGATIPLSAGSSTSSSPSSSSPPTNLFQICNCSSSISSS